jgi:hypothetical protein
MRKLLGIPGVMLIYSLSAFSQNHLFTGRVLSKDGTPVPGASVRLDGSKDGTMTDNKGDFL